MEGVFESMRKSCQRFFGSNSLGTVVVLIMVVSRSGMGTLSGYCFLLLEHLSYSS